MATDLLQYLSYRKYTKPWSDREPLPVPNYSRSLVKTSIGMKFSGGDGLISGKLPGVVSVDGAPAARLVEVRSRETRVTHGTTWSSPVDGTYNFSGLDPNKEFDLIARDHNRVYSDVVIPAVRPWPYMLTLDLPEYFFGDIDWEGQLRGGEPPYTLTESSPSVVTLEGSTISIHSEGFVGDISFKIEDSSGMSRLFRTVQFSSASEYIGYRINITRARSHCAISELEFADTPGGPSLPLLIKGRAVESVPVYYGAGHEKENAFDGSLNPGVGTVWASGDGSRGWIGYIFNAPVQPIKEVRIAPRANINQWPIDFTIQRTKDGSTWEDCGSYTDLDSGWEDYVARPFEVVE